MYGRSFIDRLSTSRNDFFICHLCIYIYTPFQGVYNVPERSKDCIQDHFRYVQNVGDNSYGKVTFLSIYTQLVQPLIREAILWSLFVIAGLQETSARKIWRAMIHIRTLRSIEPSIRFSTVGTDA